MSPLLILLAGILTNATGSLLVKHAVDAGPLPLDRPLAVVALASALWLREGVSATWVAGIVLIVAGVVLVTMEAPSA